MSGNGFLNGSNGLDFESIFQNEEQKIDAKSIDFTRPLSEYGTAEQISTFVQGRKGTQHIYTRDLQVGGKAVQDAMEKYLAAKDHYNSGSLKESLKTPLHLFYAKESGWRDELEKHRKNAEHFELGNYLHMCILEPTRFKRVTVEPKFGLGSTDGANKLIEFWEDKLEIFNKCFVDGDEVDAETGKKAAVLAVEEMGLSLDKIDGKRAYYRILKKISGFEAVSEEHKIIIDIVHRNYKTYGGGILPKIIKNSKREISLYQTDPETGLKVRVRPDAMQFAENIGCNAIISVKSTRAESLGHFYYQSAKLTYELGEGMYQEIASNVTGRDFNCTIMIMFQTQAPFGVAALVWNAEDIEIGKYKYRNALHTALECEVSGKYPGYDAYAEEGHLGLISMKQPDWNAKELFPTDLED